MEKWDVDKNNIIPRLIHLLTGQTKIKRSKHKQVLFTGHTFLKAVSIRV